MADVESMSPVEIDRIVGEIASEGYAIARDLIPRAFIQSLVSRIDELMDELSIPAGENAFLGRDSRRIFNLLARDPLFRSIPISPATLPVIDRVLDPDCLLSSLTAIEMNPGQARQPLHADDGSYGLPRPGRTSIVIAMWALSDFTIENGGTHFIPGSHRFSRRPHRDDRPETQQVEMPAGSVLFYDGSLWHGGGENRSAERRLGLVANYCAGFLRQEECQLLAIPREDVVEFPPRLRKLIGYGTHRGLLGHVDQRNPETLIDPEAETDMIWSKLGG